MSAPLTKQFPGVNTVPVGLRWNQKLANKAKQGNYFLRVGGKKAPTKRYISGAERSWKSSKPEESSSIFSLETRLTGTPSNVTEALRYAGFDANQINDLLASAITSSNYNTSMDAFYKAEKSSHDSEKKEQKTTTGLELENLEWLVKNLDGVKCVSKTGETKCSAVAKGRTGPTKPLSERVAALPADSLIDVSNMDKVTGKGATKAKKKYQEKTGKYYAGAVPFLSNNLESYVAALQLVYGPDAERQFADEIRTMSSLLSQKAGATRVPTTTLGVQPVVSSSVPPRVPTPQRLGTVLPAPTVSRIPSVASPVGTRGGVPTMGLRPFKQ